jgi:Flp pilus assembly protein TadB
MAEYAAVAAVVIGVAAAGASAYASYEQAEQQKKSAKYNQRVAENQAAQAKEQGKLAAESERDRQRRLLATQHVRQAASGVLTTEGSPLVVQADSVRQGQRDLQLIEYGTDVRATGWSAEAELQRGQASWYRKAGAINAGVSLLGGVSSAAGQYAYTTRRAA